MLTIRCLLLFVVGGLLGIPATTAAQAPGVKKEDLRWDGKPFSYWQAAWRTELKPECQMEIVRALAAFGARGYAEEGTETIIAIAKANNGTNGTKIGTVCRDAFWEIANPAVSRLLVGGFRDATTRSLAHAVLGTPWITVISADDILALMILSQDKDVQISKTAIAILSNQMNEPSVAATLRNRDDRPASSRRSFSASANSRPTW